MLKPRYTIHFYHVNFLGRDLAKQHWEERSRSPANATSEFDLNLNRIATSTFVSPPSIKFQKKTQKRFARKMPKAHRVSIVGSRRKRYIAQRLCHHPPRHPIPSPLPKIPTVGSAGSTRHFPSDPYGMVPREFGAFAARTLLPREEGYSFCSVYDYVRALSGRGD